MPKGQETEVGLSLGNRKFIVGIFFVGLLLYGPIQPYGMLVRIGYLIILPILLWFSLGYIGRKWSASTLENDYLTRGIFGIISGVLLVGAYSYYTASSHTQCTQEIRTRDGYECVGDYVGVEGPDKGQAFLLVIFAGAAAWYAISKHALKPDPED